MSGCIALDLRLVVIKSIVVTPVHVFRRTAERDNADDGHRDSLVNNGATFCRLILHKHYLHSLGRKQHVPNNII